MAIQLRRRSTRSESAVEASMAGDPSIRSASAAVVTERVIAREEVELEGPFIVIVVGWVVVVGSQEWVGFRGAIGLNPRYFIHIFRPNA